MIDKYIRAKHAPRCCTDCARMAAIFTLPRTIADGLALAIESGLGDEGELYARILDMRASGLLVRVTVNDGVT